MLWLYLVKKRRPRRRGLAARCDQSLSLACARELLPQPLCGRKKRDGVSHRAQRTAAAVPNRPPRTALHLFLSSHRVFQTRFSVTGFLSCVKTPSEAERHKDDIADGIGSRQADKTGCIIFFGLIESPKCTEKEKIIGDRERVLPILN